MAVIKYYEKAKVVNEVKWVYEEITEPNKVGRKISKQKAMEIVKEQMLVLVHKNKYGCVWDTPDKEFYENFKKKKIKEL